MKACINAVGSFDSLGRDRASEIRGLIPFGGKPVIAHNTKRFLELGVDTPIVVYASKDHADAYRAAAKDFSLPLKVVEYHGLQNQFLVYSNALQELGDNDNVLVTADDNLYDFSLVPMLSKFNYLNSLESDGANLIAVRDIGQICDRSEEKEMNFGTCRFDERGKVTGAYHSFAPQTALESQRVMLDIHMINARKIPFFVSMGALGDSGLEKFIHTWWEDFYVWKANKGFWADIGKPRLRKRAEEYYNQLK